MLYPLLRSALFGLEAEQAHDLAVSTLERAQKLGVVRRSLARRYAHPRTELAIEVLGLDFTSPLGVAAGFDKNARLVPALAALGFGAVEVGTVTPRPQPGNPKPRLWRHPRHRSLQNCLGFNGLGMDAVADSIESLERRPLPIGINLGKNKDTPQERAGEDYERLLERFAPLADYFVLNLSSPNTPQLRDLQVPEFVARLLRRAAELAQVPVLVKIAPDLPDRAAVELAVSAVEAGAAGVIATNTTIDYSLVPGARPIGGLSGGVLRERSFELLCELAAELGDRAVLVSVGGIDSAAEAYRRIRAGATLVQLYTAMVFEGPGVARRINDGLVELLAADGLTSVSDAVGVERRRR